MAKYKAFPTDNTFSKIIIGTNIDAIENLSGSPYYDISGELLTTDDFIDFELNNPVYIYIGNTFIGEFNVTYYNEAHLPGNHFLRMGNLSPDYQKSIGIGPSFVDAPRYSSFLCWAFWFKSTV